MIVAEPTSRGAGQVLVGPAGAERCLYRLARERQSGPRWWAGAPVDEGIRLRAETNAARRAALRDLVICRAEAEDPPGTSVVDIVGDRWSDLPGEPPGDQQVERTLEAMRAGATVVWGAVLPADRRSGRAGMRVTLARLPTGRYVPVLVVNHKVVDPRLGRAGVPVRVSRLLRWMPEVDPGLRLRRHPQDLERLSHAWRLLEAMGETLGETLGQGHGEAAGVGPDEATVPMGAVLGLGSELAVVHHLGPALAQADLLHRERLAVARGVVIPQPSRAGECRTCPWWSGWDAGIARDGSSAVVVGCRAKLERRHDVSLVVTGVQAAVLRDDGVHTVDQLAHPGLAQPDRWSGEPFGDAVLRARARRDGLTLVPKVAAPSIPRADIEVDIDMESHLDDGAYLWGTLLTIRDGGEAVGGADGEVMDGAPAELRGRYRPFVTWNRLPGPDEGRAFAEFWTWIQQIREDAESAGRTFRAYCYSAQAENGWMLSTARRFGPEGSVATVNGVPSVEEVREFLGSGLWTDVHAAVTSQFVSTVGSGLKAVAPVAGFAWRDEGASGEASVRWYRQAVGGSEGIPGRGVLTDFLPSENSDPLHWMQKILRYNEDDVRAEYVVREWISSMESTRPHLAEFQPLFSI